MNEGIKMKGQIEVILEDRYGKVKQREISDNTITDAYLKYLLLQGMSPFAATSRVSAGNLVSAAVPSSFGIYVMSEPIVVNRDTYLPPYVDNARNGLLPAVAFYNVDGATTETPQVMIPENAHCFFDRAKLEYSMEYVKKTYTGTVRSIAIGRVHTAPSQLFNIQNKDGAMPPEMYASTTSYLLENISDGTILYKLSSDGTEAYVINLKTNQYSRTTNASLIASANIATQFGGLAVNGHLFKVGKKSISGSNYTVTLTYVKNFLSATTVGSMDIVVSGRAGTGLSLNTTVVPVAVARAAQNKIEIFVTLTIGNHSGEYGANVKKVVVDVSDINSIQTEIVDMGVIKYAISGYGTNVGQYATGLFYDGKYYLPYYYVVNSDGTLGHAASTSYQEGVVLSSDFNTVHRILNYKCATNAFNFPVISGAGEVIQLLANTVSPHVFVGGQVVSGTNLENSVTKLEPDTLRVIYRYRIA